MSTIRAYQPLDAFTLDVDVQFDRRVTGLFGPSGSGKTTLLDCISGLRNPTRGMIRIAETVLFDREGASKAKIDVATRDRRIGYVFQDPLLFEHMTVRRNLLYARRTGSGPSFDDVVNVLELMPLLERRARELSGGEQRRVAIGRALLSAPRMLLLDEPLTGLERRLAGKTLSYIRAVLDAFDLPAIYVSHLVSDVVYLCDEVVILEEGKVKAQGHPAELIAEMEQSDADHQPGLKNILTASVERIDAASATVTCKVGQQSIVASGRVANDARLLTLIVAARDIMIATQPPVGISARNVLSGRVERIAPVGGHHVAFVDAGTQWMIELTAAAIAELELAPGKAVHIVLKASSIQIVDARL